MNKYYLVISTIDNRGHATSRIAECIEADEKPESTFENGRLRDIYEDWFKSREEAEAFTIDFKDGYNGYN